MDAQSKEMLETILAKDKDSLSDGEVQFLMARRSYLNDEQKKRYADLIKLHEAGKLSGTAGDGLDSMSVADLKALAESEGVELNGARAKAAIVAAIREARKGQ